MISRPFVWYINYTGLFAFYAFAFFACLSTAGVNIAFAVLTVATVLHKNARADFYKDPLFRLGLIFALYLIWRSFSAAAQYPETSDLKWKEGSNWLKLFGFLLVSWWLKGNLERLSMVLLLALTGLVIGMLMNADLDKIMQFQIGDRTGFKQRISFSGLVSASALYGLVLFSPRLCQAALGRAVFRIGIVFWIILIYLMVYSLISSKLRSAWLAFVLVSPPLLSYYYRAWIKRAKGSSRRLLTMFVSVVLILLAGFVLFNRDPVFGRLSEEPETVNSMLDGKIEDLPRTSLGYRVDVQRFGAKKWLERPVLGWGPGSTKYLIRESSESRLWHPSWKGGVEPMDHLHNSYLEMLLQHGIAGSALLFMGVFLIFRALATAYRTQVLPMDYYLFFIGVFGITAIWAGFDFRILHSEWRAYWCIIAGGSYTFNMAVRDQ